MGRRIEIKHYCDYCDNKDTVSVQIIYGVLGTGDKGTYQTFSINSPNKRQTNNE
jgi:hypothetical protein